MCSVCRSFGIDYANSHSVENCPYKLACYCSFCGQNGHTTTRCPYDKGQMLIDEDEDPNLQYYVNHYEPSMEVVDMDENIRAFLLSYNIALSGKKEENRVRLVNLAADLGLVLRWIDPKNGDVKQIDANGARKKGKKNNAPRS